MVRCVLSFSFTVCALLLAAAAPRDAAASSGSDEQMMQQTTAAPPIPTSTKGRARVTSVPAMSLYGRAAAEPDASELAHDPAAARAALANAPDLVPAVRPQVETLSTPEICAVIEGAAAANALPVEFFTRMIWQESRFRPHAVSPAGALGIAQFMPRTANARGLVNPLDPIEALHESAELVSDLLRLHGNLGLAAAAYNAGSRRVQDWLAKRGSLPQETQAYVERVTGHRAEEWASATPPHWQDGEIAVHVPCPQVVARAGSGPAATRVASREESDAKKPQKPVPPWGVQLSGDWSQAKALAEYERLRKKFKAILKDREPLVVKSRTPGRGPALMHKIRLAEDSREDAQKLCSRLRAAGGSCVVLPNPTRTR